MFTKFLHDVEASVPLLTCTTTGRYCIPFLNARPKSERGQFQRLQKAPKINWLPTSYGLPQNLCKFYNTVDMYNNAEN